MSLKMTGAALICPPNHILSTKTLLHHTGVDNSNTWVHHTGYDNPDTYVNATWYFQDVTYGSSINTESCCICKHVCYLLLKHDDDVINHNIR